MLYGKHDDKQIGAREQSQGHREEIMPDRFPDQSGVLCTSKLENKLMFCLIVAERQDGNGFLLF